MEPRQPSYREAYHSLKETAQAFGLNRFARVIMNRAALADSPYLVLFGGTARSGKSAVLSLIMERALPCSNLEASWLNMYRAVHPRRECIEVYRTSPRRHTELVPMDEAFSYLSEAKPGEIDSVVWNVYAPEMPANVVLAEIPAHCSTTALEDFIWLADAVVWTMRADQVDHASTRQALATLQTRRNQEMPTLGVVTRLDLVPRTECDDLLQRVRDEVAPGLDRILSIAGPFNPRAVNVDTISAPVRIDIRTRLCRSARRTRENSHTAFLESMKNAICEHFEQQVDVILRDRAICLKHGRTLVRRTGKLIDLARRRVVDVLTVEPERPFPGRDALSRTLSAFSRALIAETTSLITAPVPFAQTATEQSELEVFRFQTFPPGELTQLLANERLEPRALVLRALHIVDDWLNRLRQATEEYVQDAVASAFTARHGFPLDEALDALSALEKRYLELKGRDFAVPTPFQTAESISPVQFLYFLQDPSFVDRWNRSVARRLSHGITPRVRRRLAARLDHARDTLLREWDETLEPLREHLERDWKDNLEEQLQRNDAAWSIAWAVSHMRGSLKDPVAYLAEHRFSLPAPDGVSLLLTNDMDRFLVPFKKIEKGPDDRLPYFLIPNEQLVSFIRESAAACWELERSVRIHTSLKTDLYRRVAAAAAFLVGTGGTWLYTFGTNTTSLTLLPFLVATQTGASWHWIDRIIHRNSANTPDRVAEQLHAAVRDFILEFSERLHTRLDDLYSDEQFHTDVEKRILERSTAESPVIGYGALIERLGNL